MVAYIQPQFDNHQDYAGWAKELPSSLPWVEKAKVSPEAGVVVAPGSFFTSNATGNKVHFRVYEPSSISSHSSHTIYFFHGLNDHANKQCWVQLLEHLCSTLGVKVRACTNTIVK